MKIMIIRTYKYIVNTDTYDAFYVSNDYLYAVNKINGQQLRILNKNAEDSLDKILEGMANGAPVLTLKP